MLGEVAATPTPMLDAAATPDTGVKLAKLSWMLPFPRSTGISVAAAAAAEDEEE